MVFLRLDSCAWVGVVGSVGALAAHWIQRCMKDEAVIVLRGDRACPRAHEALATDRRSIGTSLRSQRIALAANAKVTVANAGEQI